MKKRTAAYKKSVRLKTKKKAPQSITLHRIFIYSSAGIAVVTLLFAVLHVALAKQGVNGSDLYAANVLSDDDENKAAEEAQKEAEKQAEEQKKIEEKAAEEQQKIQEEQKEQEAENKEETPKPTISKDSIKVKTQTEGRKSEMEIETADGQKIKTKVEDDGTTKIEVEHKNLKLKYKFVDGQFVLEAEDEDGKAVELEEDELNELEDEVENELEDDGIKIASSGAGKIKFAKNKYAATTDFPLSIDLGTNQLVVTTPAGQKVVAVLPDVAVENMLSTGVINALIPDETGSESGNVEFTVENNEPVYKIAGLKKFKFLGFIPITQPVTAVVSSETGLVVKTEKSLFGNLVDFLSP